MNAIDLLTEDHRCVSRLMSELFGRLERELVVGPRGA